jgi:hypothetical protein
LRPHRVVVLAIAVAAAGCAARPIVAEIEACQLPPDARQELRLTPEQDRRLSRVYAQLEAERQQVEAVRARRRQPGATPEEIERATTMLIDVERRCREQLQPAFSSILTEKQYATILVMEENHRKRIQARRPAS